jgi:hypothetical protein
MGLMPTWDSSAVPKDAAQHDLKYAGQARLAGEAPEHKRHALEPCPAACMVSKYGGPRLARRYDWRISEET